MSRIRVLQIVTRLAVRGVPRQVLEVAAGLDPERFAVEVLAGRSEPGEGELWTEAAQRGIRTQFLPILQRTVAPIADVRALVALYQRIRQGNYDIVHTHISKAGILGRLAARLGRVRVIVHTYHGRVDEVQRHSWKGSLFRLCERYAARWSDSLIAVSEETRRQCLENGIGRSDQYRVIHNGIDLPRFLDYRKTTCPFAAAKGAPVIGTVGSLTPEKGIDLLLQAVPLLLPRHPQLRVCVVGDGNLRSRLQTMASQLGIEERVSFPGIVADVRPWVAHFDVFVVSSNQEGLPTVLLEAMALGRPIVASRVGGIPEIVADGESALLVEPGDPGVLARAIDSLLQDEERRLRLGRQGRKQVAARFGLEGMLRQLAGEYERLLAGRGSG